MGVKGVVGAPKLKWRGGFSEDKIKIKRETNLGVTQAIFNTKRRPYYSLQKWRVFLRTFPQPRDARWGITRVRTCLRSTENAWTLWIHFLPSSSARRGLNFMFTSLLGLDVYVALVLSHCKVQFSRLPIIRTFKGNGKKLILYRKQSEGKWKLLQVSGRFEL